MFCNGAQKRLLSMGASGRHAQKIRKTVLLAFSRPADVKRTMKQTTDPFTPIMPHGDLQEIFPDVYFVTGTTRPTFEGKQWQFSRNMTVVREGNELTLFNTVRLDDAGLAALDRLGKVVNVVKLGSFHGIDDAFYIDRYRAKLWAFPGMTHESGLPTTHELGPNSLPVADASIFVFETAKMPEVLVLLRREGGILISCDSLQNWAEVDKYFSEESGAMMTAAGFIKPANIGPGWIRFAEPQASDFKRLLELPFRHLLGAHGSPLLGEAHERFTATIGELFSDAG